MIRKSWRHNNLKESFIGAFKGIIIILKSERYAKLVGICGLLVILAAFILRVSRIEIALLVAVITMVLVAETFNAIVENIMNMIKPYRDPHIKVLKEASAGIVLLASFGAAITGGLILLPKIITIFK
jgi:diacylglycerol kinase